MKNAAPKNLGSADSISIEKAFSILYPAMKAKAAAATLNRAIADGNAHVWANNKVIPDEFDFERHLRIVAREKSGRWTAEMEMRAAVENFHTITWTMSRAEVTALREKWKSQKHPGGAPRVYEHDKIRAAAFIVLSKKGFFKKGVVSDAILEGYSGNDLAADVRGMLGEESPKDTQLGKILDPLLKHLKLLLKADR
jgi:hypothetical protein